MELVLSGLDSKQSVKAPPIPDNEDKKEDTDTNEQSD